MNRQLEKFNEAIRLLEPHNRHGHNLCSTAAYGAMANLSDAEIFNRIMMDAPGNSRPDARDVISAIKYADRLRNRPNHLHQERCAFHRENDMMRWSRQRENLPEQDRNFVANLIGNGIDATIASIMARSPVPIPPQPHNQACAQLLSLDFSPTGMTWAGYINSKDPQVSKRPFTPNSSGIISCPMLSAKISNGGPIPTHITLNPLTGEIGRTKTGTLSYDCLNTLASIRYALFEFDDLPANDQVRFLSGLLDWTTEKDRGIRVHSAVWSGSKSIHITMRIRERNGRICDACLDENDFSYHKALWRGFLRQFASSDDPSLRIDTSGALTGGRASTHTRLAGARHPATGAVARLLYLSEPPKQPTP